MTVTVCPPVAAIFEGPAALMVGASNVCVAKAVCTSMPIVATDRRERETPPTCRPTTLLSLIQLVTPQAEPPSRTCGDCRDAPRLFPSSVTLMPPLETAFERNALVTVARSIENRFAVTRVVTSIVIATEGTLAPPETVLHSTADDDNHAEFTPAVPDQRAALE
jgi:hypothetical protein